MNSEEKSRASRKKSTAKRRATRARRMRAAHALRLISLALSGASPLERAQARWISLSPLRILIEDV